MDQKNPRSKPHLHIFGSEINDEESFKDGKKKSDWVSTKGDKSAGISWGVVVLLSGVILLLNTLNILPWEFWDHVWQFWPALLILIGIAAILGNNFVSRMILGILTTFVCLFIIIFGLIRVNSSLVKYFSPELINFVNNLNVK